MVAIELPLAPASIPSSSPYRAGCTMNEPFMWLDTRVPTEMFVRNARMLERSRFVPDLSAVMKIWFSMRTNRELTSDRKEDHLGTSPQLCVGGTCDFCACKMAQTPDFELRAGVAGKRR